MKQYTVKQHDNITEWYLDGKLHREDGPAIVWADGGGEWYLNGKQLTEEEFLKRTQTVELTLDEIAEKLGISASNLKIKK